MAVSSTEIANRALQLLGASPITSLNEDHKNARAAKLAYDPVRRAMLRSHDWSCAIKRASLAADATAPSFGRGNSFTVPSDWLRTLPPYPEDNHPDWDWLMEGRKILTNDSAPLNIRYIFDLEDPNQMDSLFREAFSHNLAVAMCEALTNSAAKKRDLALERDAVIREARRANAIERPAQKPPEDPWVTCRL